MTLFIVILVAYSLCLCGLVASFHFHSLQPSEWKAKATLSSAWMATAENAEFGLKPRVQIEYCPGCKWMLRSAWMAQELLSTFEKELREVALIPSPTSGTFTISIIDKVVIWDRRDPATPGFPDIKDLKKRVRDLVDPERDLGHSDR